MLDFSQTNLTHSLKHAIQFTSSIQRSFSTPCLSFTTESDEKFDVNPRIEIIGRQGNLGVRTLVVEATIALAFGVKPQPVSSGQAGAYFLHARNGDKVAVAKPIDEEPLAFNNPKGFAGTMLGEQGMKRSIRVGETGFGEAAAYLLDSDGFAGVPPTALVNISYVTFHVSNSDTLCKIASLQSFVDHDSDAGDLGPSGFSVASIHRIGILDVRILNLDRHAGNTLVKHGQENCAAGQLCLFCLPDSTDDPYLEWLHWPQASIPFSDSEVEYISNLDPFKDSELLRAELPSMRESSIRILVICTIFLKEATAAGLCLADIGKMMIREFCGGEENLSALEKVCVNAKAGMRKLDDDYGDTDQDDRENGMFQFQNECEDVSNQTIDVPELLQSPVATGKPPKIPRVSSVKLMTGLCESLLSSLDEKADFCDESYSLNTIVDNGDGKESSDSDDQKVAAGSMMKGVSFSVPNYSNDNAGLSLGEMGEEEWELFLEAFRKLLPEAFECRKNMGLSKHRLGQSCEFRRVIQVQESYLRRMVNCGSPLGMYCRYASLKQHDGKVTGIPAILSITPAVFFSLFPIFFVLSAMYAKCRCLFSCTLSCKSLF